METIVENFGNTHTDASFNGKYMNTLFHEAEAKIMQCCNANPETNIMIPIGTGATAAIEVTQKILGTYIPAETINQISAFVTFADIKDGLRKKGKLALVIVSEYEHHSNDITWRNQLCDVLHVPLG